MSDRKESKKESKKENTKDTKKNDNKKIEKEIDKEEGKEEEDIVDDFRNDIDNETDKKRKRAPLSSTSSALDSSNASPLENKKQKKKKKKGGDVDKTNTDTTSDIQDIQSNVTKISKQISELSLKVSSMVSKEDGSLRVIIKEVFSQMKDDFLKSVIHRIDVLEGKLFDKECENTELQDEVKKLEDELKNQRIENSRLQHEISKNENQFNEKINRLEQYSRINNIRIDGVTEEKDENSQQTEKKVLKELNTKMPTLKLSDKEIEIAHRVGKSKKGKPRQIIVKFFSRETKFAVLSKKKTLKGTGIFVNEDLTQLNQIVLACVRKKQPDEVEAVWTINGTIFYKDKTDVVHKVHYNSYQDWLDLPWPVEEEKENKKQE